MHAICVLYKYIYNIENKARDRIFNRRNNTLVKFQFFDHIDKSMNLHKHPQSGDHKLICNV